MREVGCESKKSQLIDMESALALPNDSVSLTLSKRLLFLLPFVEGVVEESEFNPIHNNDELIKIYKFNCFV